jgi:hypothetical protein
MDAPSFEPAHAIRFDLPHGSVHAGREGDRLILIPAAALDDLVLSSSAEAAVAFGRAVGAGIGRRAAARMSDPRAASLESFVTQLAGETALAGVGVLSIERWGRALVVVVEESPLAGTLLPPMVESALEAASGRRVWSTLLTRDQRAARLLVASERAVERVRDWIASGMTWGEALAKAHEGTS